MSNRTSKNFAFAIMLIFAGLVITLHQLDMLSPKADDILISWPMLIIAIGLLSIFNHQSRVGGYIIVAVGLFFLIPDFFDVDASVVWKYWPVLLILLGLLILFRYFRSKSDGFMNRDMSEGDVIDEINVFAGSDKILTSPNLKGGKVTSIFGGSKIDLTQAKLMDGYAVIDVFFMFGGTSIIVPPDWQIENRVNSILGGFSDERRNVQSVDGKENVQKLVIKGMAILGGGDIKSS